MPFHCNGDLRLDGECVSNKLRGPHSSAAFVTVYRTCYTSPTTERPYMFSSLEVTGLETPMHISFFSPSHLGEPDDDAYLSADSSREIGEIRLQINRVELLQLISYQQSLPPPLDQKVHERSKKAMVHRIG